MLLDLGQHVPIRIHPFGYPSGVEVLQTLPKRHPEDFFFSPSCGACNSKNYCCGQGWVGAFGLSFPSLSGRADAAMTAARSPAKLAATLDMSVGEMFMQNSVTFLPT